jgi:hypothetical protein
MAEISYREHVAQRKKEALGAEAEYQGWVYAGIWSGVEAPVRYSEDVYLQGRFTQGFQDGTLVLAVEQERQP